MRRLLIAAAFALALTSCGKNAEPRISWEKFEMDASRTGVRHLTGRLTQDAAFGTIDGETYTAPNGRQFKADEVYGAAKILIGAQQAVASKKKIIGTAVETMLKKEPQSELSNMYVDALMDRVGELTGKKVDVGLTNFGGIRMDFEKGDIMVEDVEAMFPFNNTLIYVPVKGRDLREVLDTLAARKWEVVGGVKARVKEGKLVSATVGGAPIQDDKVYGLATISFLLFNGDGLTLAPLAVDGQYIDTHERIDSCILGYIRNLTAAGKDVSYQIDDRIIIE